MKRKKYTAKLLSMAVAANLIFSSFAMPVVSAETGTVGAEAVREAGMADGSDGNAAAGKESAKEMETSANETVTEAATEAAVPSGETLTEAADPSDETSTEMNTPAGEAETETATPEEQVPRQEEAGTEPAADEEDPSGQPFEAVTETEDVTELSADQAAGPVSDPAEQSQAEPIRVAAPVQITVSDQAVTPDTTSLTAEFSRVPSSGILRIVQLEKGETYEQSKLNSYTSLHFSVVATLSAGKNVLALTSKPAVGKQLLVVLRDSSGTGVTDYTSVPITVTAKETERETEAEQKTPEQILANTSVAAAEGRSSAHGEFFAGRKIC